MNMNTVRVDLGNRGYDIKIGSGIIGQTGIWNRLKGRNVAIITDDNVAPLHLEAFCARLDQNKIHHQAIVIPHGESSKCFSRLQTVCHDLLERGLDRQSLIMGFGGGVVGDLAGFAASIVLRGVAYIQIPTTLLAQVDSAVGGKTGINTDHGKNLIGTFHQPGLVVSDLDYLDTLPRRELLAGYAELVKYGLIADRDFFSWLEIHGESLCNGDKEKQSEAVRRGCAIKADLVVKDEYESGSRALLNLGHTFGHGLETIAGYRGLLLHGEAVSIGMVAAFCLAAQMGVCPEDEVVRLREHLTSVGLPVVPPPSLLPLLNPDHLLDIMGKDKKNRNGVIRFILPQTIGHAMMCPDVSPERVCSLLSEIWGI